MFHSQNFLTKGRRIAHDPPDHGGTHVKDLETLFLRHLPGLPEGFGGAVFAYVMDSDREAAEKQQLLADLLDLTWMQYDDQADPLSREDWSFLRDLIDEYAPELELDLVQYVMERVVSHHAL